MNKSILIAVGIAAAAALWIASGAVATDDEAPKTGPSPAEGSHVEVKVEVLTARPMQRELTIQGRTAPVRDVVLKAEIEGQVEAVLAEKGAAVAQGAPLVRLDMRDRAARRAEADALVAQRLLQFQQSSQLASRDFASRSKVAEARAGLESARATLETVREAIANTTIIAPFAGVFDENLVEVGGFVKIGEGVARLVQLDPVNVIAEVSEREIGTVNVGRAANITLIDGRTKQGAVTWVSRTADATTRTYRVEISVPNADGSVVGGMTAEVRLPLATINAHLVSPAILTLSDKGEVGVKTLDDQNRVAFVPVDIVSDGPDGVWLGGLPDQVRLITAGQDYVVDGQTVATTTAEGAR